MRDMSSKTECLGKIQKGHHCYDKEILVATKGKKATGAGVVRSIFFDNWTQQAPEGPRSAILRIMPT